MGFTCGVWLWATPSLYLIRQSSMCRSAPRFVSLPSTPYILYVALRGGILVPSVTREDSALFLWLRDQNIWTLVIVSCCHLPLGLQWLDPRELILSSSDSSKRSSSWVLSVRCPAIPVHVTTGLLIAAMRQLNRKPYHLKNHKTSFTHICWTLARDRHCGWWCKKGHKHKWRLVLSLVGVCSLAE